MASNMNKVAKELKNAIEASDERKPKPYDTQAEVLRVENGTAWVHIPGGIEETPVRLTINAKEGDMVNIHVANGSAWITGNGTNPPTDDTRAEEVYMAAGQSIDFVSQLVDKDVTVKSITAATGYIDDLYSKNIYTDNIAAATGYIGDLTADHITANDIAADHAEINDLDVNYAQINAANVTDLSAQNAWVNKIMVQTGLIAHESDIFTLDAIQVNAANITAGTIDVNRLIVTIGNQKYLVNIDPTTGTPSYEKLDGNIVEPRTITADKIVAHDITVQEITTENLVGTNGWINLNQGKFFFTTNGTTWANTTNGIMWDGTNLKIKGDVNITAGNVYTKTEADAKYATQASLAITNDAITSEVRAREASDNLLLDSDAPNLGAVYASANRYISDASSTSEYVTANNVELTDPPEQGIKYARRFVCNGTNTTSVGRAYAFYNSSDNVIPYIPNTTYTATWWARCTNGQGKTNCHYPVFDGTTSNHSSPQVDLTSTWQKFTVVFTTGSTPNTNYNRIWFYARFPANTSGTIDICGCKLVAGDAVEAYSTKIEQTANNVLIQATASDTTAAQGGQHLIQSLINVAPSGVTIDASKVNITGVITAINNDTTTTINGGKITTGTLSAGAVNATSGTFNTANIPNLSAAKITSGTIDIGRVPAAALNSNVLVGGRNLIMNTGRSRVSPASAQDSGGVGSAYVSPGPVLTDYGLSIANVTSTEFTYSFDYTVTGNSAADAYIYVQMKGSQASGPTYGHNVKDNPTGHFTHTFKLTSTQASSTTKTCNIRLRNATDGAILTVSNIKLELGNKETDWTLAPEDGLNPNLLIGTQKMDTWYVGTDASKSTTGEFGVATLNGTSSAYTARLDGRPSIKTSTAINGTPLWLSFDYTASVDTNLLFRFCGSDQKDGSPTLGTLTKYYQKTLSLPAASSYTRYIFNVPVLSTSDLTTVSSDVTTNSVFVRFYNRTNSSVLKIRRMKLEHGISNTSWSPSEEELQTCLTRIDEAGIRIHPSNTVNNSVVIDATGMEIFNGGTSSTNSVAMYGATARVGKESEGHVLLEAAEVKICWGSDVLAHIGYSDEYNAQYYTFGSRKSSSVIGLTSFAEGINVTSSSWATHAEGRYTTASGYDAHAEGNSTTASGYASHAGGTGTIAKGACQTAIGSYNVAQGSPSVMDLESDLAFIIGNGDSDARSNALTVSWKGDVNIASGAVYKVNGTVVASERVKKTITPTASGVSNYSSYGNSYYEKAGNVVHVHVGVKGVTANTVVAIATLPSGYRPTSMVFGHGTGGASNNIGYMDISTAGVIQVRSETGYIGADVTYLV